MLFATVTDDDTSMLGRTHDVPGWYSLISEWKSTTHLLTQKLLPVWREISDTFVGRAVIRWMCLMGNMIRVFTARCTLVQSAVLRSHVVCLSVRLSVRLSVTLVDCDHIGWNSSRLITPLVSLGCSLFATPTWRVCSKGNTPKFGSKLPHPLLIWASETFDRKLRPNGYR